MHTCYITIVGVEWTIITINHLPHIFNYSLVCYISVVVYWLYSLFTLYQECWYNCIVRMLFFTKFVPKEEITVTVKVVSQSVECSLSAGMATLLTVTVCALLTLGHSQDTSHKV